VQILHLEGIDTQVRRTRPKVIGPLETDPHPRHPKIVTGRGDKGDSGSAPKSLACVLGEPRPRSGVSVASASPITFGRTDGELVRDLVVELVGH